MNSPLDSYANSLLTNLINRAIITRKESMRSRSRSRISGLVTFIDNREAVTTIEIGGPDIGDPHSTSSDASGPSSYGLKHVDKAQIVDPGSY